MNFICSCCRGCCFARVLCGAVSRQWNEQAGSASLAGPGRVVNDFPHYDDVWCVYFAA